MRRQFDIRLDFVSGQKRLAHTQSGSSSVNECTGHDGTAIGLNRSDGGYNLISPWNSSKNYICSLYYLSIRIYEQLISDHWTEWDDISFTLLSIASVCVCVSRISRTTNGLHPASHTQTDIQTPMRVRDAPIETNRMFMSISIWCEPQTKIIK